MKAYLDIENSRTKEVKTIVLPVIKCDLRNKVILDLKGLSDSELDILRKAVSLDKKYSYTDIELFFIDNDEKPNFGPDYDIIIDGSTLVLSYVSKKSIVRESRNEDWTFSFNEKFLEISKLFLKSDKFNYMIIFYDNQLKYEFLKDKPGDNIFMEYIVSNGYKAVSVFKKKKVLLSNSDVRDNLIYVNGYSELD